MAWSRSQSRLSWLLYCASILPYLFYTVGRLQTLHPASPTYSKIHTILSTHLMVFWLAGGAGILVLIAWFFFVSRWKGDLLQFLAVALTHMGLLGLLLQAAQRLLPITSRARYEMIHFFPSIFLPGLGPVFPIRVFLTTLFLVLGWGHLNSKKGKSFSKASLFMIAAVLLALPLYPLATSPSWGIVDEMRTEIVLVKDSLNPALFKGDPALPFLRTLHPLLMTKVLVSVSHLMSPERAYQVLSLIAVLFWPLSYLIFGKILRADPRWVVSLFLFAFFPLLRKLYDGLGGLLALGGLLLFMQAQNSSRTPPFLFIGFLLSAALFAHPPSVETASAILCISLFYISVKKRKGWKWCFKKGMLMFGPVLVAGCIYLGRIQRGGLSLTDITFLESTDFLWGRAYNVPKSLFDLLGQFSALYLLGDLFCFVTALLALYGLQHLLRTKRPVSFLFPFIVIVAFVLSAFLLIGLGWFFLKPQEFVFSLHLVIPIIASYGFVQLYDRLRGSGKGIQRGFCISVCLFLSLGWLMAQEPPARFEVDKDFHIVCLWLKEHTPPGTKIATYPMESDVIRWIAERSSIASEELGGWGRHYQEAGEAWVETSRETIQAMFSEDPLIVKRFVSKYNVTFFVDDTRYGEGTRYRLHRLLDIGIKSPWIRSQSREWREQMRQGPYVVYEFLGRKS